MLPYVAGTGDECPYKGKMEECTSGSRPPYKGKMEECTRGSRPFGHRAAERGGGGGGRGGGGGGGAGGLLTLGPVIKHGARAARLVFFLCDILFLSLPRRNKLYTFRAE